MKLKTLFLVALASLHFSAPAFDSSNSRDCPQESKHRLCSIYGIQTVWKIERPGLIQLMVSYYEPVFDRNQFIVDGRRTEFSGTGFFVERLPAKESSPFLLKHRDGRTSPCFDYSGCLYRAEKEWLEYVDVGFSPQVSK